MNITNIPFHSWVKATFIVSIGLALVYWVLNICGPHYRVKEDKGRFYPQKLMFGIYWANIYRERNWCSLGSGFSYDIFYLDSFGKAYRFVEDYKKNKKEEKPKHYYI